MSLNKVILIGTMCSTPELKQTPTGTAICSFAVAVDRKYTPSNGQRETDFINIVCWRQTAEFVANHFAKGKAILICGSIQTRKWTDDNGNNRYATEVVADEVSFVGAKPTEKDGEKS